MVEKGNEPAAAAGTAVVKPAGATRPPPQRDPPLTQAERDFIIANELAAAGNRSTRGEIEEALRHQEQTKGPDFVRLYYAFKYPPGAEAPGAGHSPWWE